MTAAQIQQTDAACEVDNSEAEIQRIAMRRAEEVLADPVQGAAMLRAGSILMAYLAAHDPDPAAALQSLITEQVGNAQLCLMELIAAEIASHGKEN